MKAKIAKKKIALTIKKNLDVICQLNRQFEKLGINLKKLNHISTDFADIYSACEEYIEIIKKIISKKKINREAIANDIAMIEVILYHHIYWHMRELKNPIIKLIQALYGRKEKDIITTIFKFKNNAKRTN